MSIWWTQCLLVAQTNINEGAEKQTESQVVLFFIFFQTLITFLWIIIDGSQVNGLKTEIHPSPSYFQSSGDRTHILFISSARSSSVHHGLLHTSPLFIFFKFGEILPLYIHNSLSLSFSVQYTEYTGWHKALQRSSDATRKSQFWTKILTPNIRCFVAKLSLSQITHLFEIFV